MICKEVSNNVYALEVIVIDVSKPRWILNEKLTDFPKFNHLTNPMGIYSAPKASSRVRVPMWL